MSKTQTWEGKQLLFRAIRKGKTVKKCQNDAHTQNQKYGPGKKIFFRAFLNGGKVSLFGSVSGSREKNILFVDTKNEVLGKNIFFCLTLFLTFFSERREKNYFFAISLH